MDMDRTGQFEEKNSAQKKFSPKQISFTYLKKKTVFLTKKFLMLVWKNQFSKQKNIWFLCKVLHFICVLNTALLFYASKT